MGYFHLQSLKMSMNKVEMFSLSQWYKITLRRAMYFYNHHNFRGSCTPKAYQPLLHFMDHLYALFALN